MANRVPTLARARWLKEPTLQNVLRVLNAGEAETRIAGGAVRNALLGLTISDVDLATTLKPDQVMARATAAGFKIKPVGLEHGTVLVIAGQATYEVTTLRCDVETDGRHAVVAFTDDWRADAERRDFTMNALYCDAIGKIYDFTEGYGDILKRKVRFVGAPGKRIAEDHLRILRFFRFHALYGRGKPDPEGLTACIRARRKLGTLSAERVRSELFKLLLAPGAVAALKTMARSGILREILPHTEDWHVISRLPPDPILRMFVLAKEPQHLKDVLRLSNSDADRLTAVSSAPALTPELRPTEQRRLLYAVGEEAWRDAVHLSFARRRDAKPWTRLLNLPKRWSLPTMPVSGDDLKRHGLKPGPDFGRALRALEDWWIASDFKPSRDELLMRLAKQRDTET